MEFASARYAELKPQIAAITDELVILSERFLAAQGNFLPHAAVLTTSGEIQLVAADPTGGGSVATAAKVLPLLHAGLREHAKATSLLAIGVAENVAITLQGQKPTQAIKVLFEHESGFSVALYTPFKKKFLRGYQLGSMFSLLADGEVLAWGDGVA